MEIEKAFWAYGRGNMPLQADKLAISHNNYGTCLRIYHTYVLPSMVYGLESPPLKPSQVILLEKTHRKFLRCIQGLSVRLAIPGIYLLLGKMTLEATLHIKMLTFLQSILVEYPISIAQPCIKININEG